MTHSYGRRKVAWGRMLLLLSLSLAILLPALTQAAETTPEYGIRDKTPQLKAFTGATIVVSPNEAYQNGILLIDRGRVVAVGKNVQIPTSATVIELPGYWIYPGFVDPVTNYGVEKPTRSRNRHRAPQYEAGRAGGDAWNDAIHSELDWVSQFKPDEKEAEQFIKQGITVVQSARLDGIFRGRSFVTTLRDALPNDVILLPHGEQFMSFDKGSSKQDYPSSLMGAIAMIRQMFLDVDWYATAHAAYRLNPDQKMPEFNAAIEALANVKQEQLLFEPGDLMSLFRADRIAKEFGLDFAYVGDGKEYVRPGLVKATGAYLVLPVNYPEAPDVGTLEDQLDVTLSELRHWERAPSDAAVMAQNGIPFAFTTHKLRVKSEFLPNVRKAIEYGLPEETALAALTIVPAKICAIDNEVGTLREGKLADFLVTDKDIFDNDATIYSVWIQGQEKVLKQMQKVDLRGIYDLSFDNQTAELTLKGKKEKPSGECKIGEKSAKLSNVSVDDNKLEFNFAPDTLGLEGVLRFSGRLEDGKLSGQYITSTGDMLSWSAFKKGDYVPEPDSTKKAGRKEPEFESRVTFPNKAYGVESQPQGQDVLIKNATVWTSEDDGILANTDILIKDGKFAAIGRGLVAPADVKVIDGSGKQVTAGIIDKHSHLAIAGDVNEGTEAITSEARIGDVVDPEDINIYRQLTGGVTSSYLLHGSANPIGATTQPVKLRWGSDSEELKMRQAPPGIKFALGENVKQSNWGDQYRARYPQSRTGVEALIRDAFQAAKEYDEAWQHYRALSSKEKAKTIPPRRDLELDPLVEVLHSQRFIACHAYVQSEMLMLIRLAESFGFMVRTFEHGLEAYKIAPELAAKDVGVSSFSDWWAYKFEVYDAIPQQPGLLNQKGALVSIKSDDVDIARRLNQEAAKSVMYTDMSQEDALKMVTINPARQLMIDDHVGSIKVGKDADFVIWNGNPLSIHSKPLQTWIEGRKYFDIDADRLMHDDNVAEKNALVQKILKESSKKKAGDRHGGRGGPDSGWVPPGEGRDSK
jgi:imidazolonepropionase-like amidohydrolase